MASLDRRNFLKTAGLTIMPAIVPTIPALASDIPEQPANTVRFFGDGEMFDPADYIRILQQVQSKQPIEADRYGVGGAVTALEKRFEQITGKEKAMFMPTGTLANQLAIAVLSGDNTKVFVQDTSHVYRDEADAAQSVFQKRLMPLAKGEAFFTAAELQQAIESLAREEVFKSGIGAVSIENPVRRNRGQMVPLEEIKKISAYCRSNNIGLHLDGARLYMASAWSGTSIKEYASYFDTVYISLYKYLGAASGAVLCGDKKVMDKMEHLVKIHGGTMFGNWANAAMALHRLDGIEERLRKAVQAWEFLSGELKKLPGVKITGMQNGTNLYLMELDAKIDAKKFHTSITKEHNLLMPSPNNSGGIVLTVNETLLYREPAAILDAFKKAIKAARA